MAAKKSTHMSRKQTLGCYIFMGVVLISNIIILTALSIIYCNLSTKDSNLQCTVCNESLPLTDNCCTDSEIETSQRMEKVIEKKVAERLDNWQSVQWEEVRMDNWTAIIPYPKPAAHLTVSPDLHLKPHTPNKDGLYYIDSWQTSSSNAFLGNGVNMWDGCVVIPLDGLYYFYSQVHFIKASERTKGSTAPFLVHTMIRYSSLKQSSQSLSKQSEAMPEPGPSGVTEKSSYISSTVRLQAGDHVCVLVNQIDLVHLNSASTYFGMYLT